jgi:hypothetical protein
VECKPCISPCQALFLDESGAPWPSVGHSHRFPIRIERLVPFPHDKGLVAFNIGFRGAPAVDAANLTFNDQLVYRLGGGYNITDAAGVTLDLAGHVDFRMALADPAGVPLEVLGGGWGRVWEGLVLRGGIGTGLTRGIGAPVIRTVFAVGWEPPRLVDQDKDGLVDKVDQCPTEPEDMDEFEDDNGCPDPDNDQDGITDFADGCPNDPEDLDTWKDEDGCPDPLTRVTINVVDEEQKSIDHAQVVLSLGEEEQRAGASVELDLIPGTYPMAAGAQGYDPGGLDLEEIQVGFCHIVELGLEGGVPVDGRSVAPPKEQIVECLHCWSDAAERWDSRLGSMASPRNREPRDTTMNWRRGFVGLVGYNAWRANFSMELPCLVCR